MQMESRSEKAIMSTDEAASSLKCRFNLKLLGAIGILVLADCAHSVHEVYVSDFGLALTFSSKPEFSVILRAGFGNSWRCDRLLKILKTSAFF